MNNCQHLSVVGWQGWREFLEARLNRYLQRFCPKSETWSQIREAILVVPSGWREADLSAADITDHILPPAISSESRWVGRPDAFDAASSFLLDLAEKVDLKSLFCLDELAKPGDPVLNDTRHIVHDELIFHQVDLENGSSNEVARTLRTGRVLGLSGVICRESIREMCDEVGERRFITDVFDGDMVVVCDF